MKIGMRTRAYSVAADGSGAAEPITQAGTRSLGAMSLSYDGRYLLAMIFAQASEAASREISSNGSGRHA